MSVYYGNKEIENIYFGSVKIGRVYKGNTLVYESAKKLQVFGYADNRCLLGSNSTSGVVVEGVVDTITAITGTLGQAGSKVTISSASDYIDGHELTYYDTLTFNGVKLYIYVFFILDGRAFDAAYIIEDAKVGSKSMHWQGTTLYPDDPSHIKYYPTSVTATEMRYSSSSHARAAENDTNYTKKGFKN